MISGPLKWYTVAETIRQAIETNLSVPVQRSGVVPGSIAWDECDCGLLAVSVYQIYPSETFPDPLIDPSGNCDASHDVAEIVIQIVRCAPQPEGPEFAPAVADLDASSQEILRDAYEMTQAVRETLCAMENDRDIYAWILRPLTSQGPTGACVGNELRVLVGLLRG
jgi:hypothetical protein